MSKWVTASVSDVNVRMLYRRVLGAARVFPTSKRASVRDERRCANEDASASFVPCGIAQHPDDHESAP
tara:strand:- start:226 stop:429 length:204 start_codon:yes stop_codon:yes gene_type:complete